ncbi:tRNA threonylcarbamoyladenosine dehydratase [Clostridium gasigenes]|uniref:tRNA threonylcarbamoyladenosine dehydratase n=1 Tax=Clostridium gasigenes TaxID=94869 RepID=UPI001C0AE1DA|nr:tRNA threonylcarbamoyladenosine dehydratase [Clostridium gasigenes]MBU3134300.1 tRNA threonylcarbamoyladenosine dehydratase [Clostridium gasigenes]
MSQNSLTRTELLVGSEGIEKLRNAKVVVFGVGGVGSFTVEALTRAGVGNLILVDDDTVCITNLNRQIHATEATVDRVKVEVMKERVLSINSKCNVTSKQIFVTPENIKDIIPDDTDYVVDAIDTITAKLALVEYCTKKNIKIMCSMGTGNKMDPTKFEVADVYDTKVCPLAKVMRHELRKRGIEKLKVVYSQEVPTRPNKGPEPVVKVENVKVSSEVEVEKKIKSKRQTPGSISFVPPVAGMIIGGEVIKDILATN